MAAAGPLLPGDVAALSAAAAAGPGGDGEGGAELPLPGFDVEPADTVVPKLQKGCEAGAGLPIAGLKQRLLDLVLRHRVIIVDAATGSGKSTMVPLYLAEQCAAMRRTCRIIVTQPRRLAARGLAARVSEQCGTAVGSFVGYRVGSQKEDYGALVVYVTSGHLLEALVHNPRHLDTFSHIVLDEVHERFVEADFLMALLRLSLSRPETLKQRIVVMSATMQQTFDLFFQPLLLPSPAKLQPGRLSLPGRTPFEVTDLMWEDVKVKFPGVLGDGFKESKFQDVRPSKLRGLPSRRRSDQLTQHCKAMAPVTAQLLCALADLQFTEHGYSCALVFLPGLDQMRELEKQLEEKARHRSRHTLSIYLVHSALEFETYKDALEPARPGEWRVVLSTNIAESSLTFPLVNAVVDLGLHRVNIYDDDSRTSALSTEWCCLASMKQRRGRTGRTNAGLYCRLIPEFLVDELPDFDESGVERSPLARVTLEATHLAELLGSPPAVRAGLPVHVEGRGEAFVNFWDGDNGGWSVSFYGTRARETVPETLLRPARLGAAHVLGLLPSPPHEDRVEAAIIELFELGALTDGVVPSVLGVACLKLPLDVGLARLVVLGWTFGCAVEMVIMAAALTLVPSCDVLRTPFNSKSELSWDDRSILQTSIEVRQRMDRRCYSEPLVVYRLCLEWLAAGGGNFGSGQPRRVPWCREAHSRIWPQFTEKVVEVSRSLVRLLPADSPVREELQAVMRCAQGRGPAFKAKPERTDWLVATLVWGLAPAGFIAVGQTAALYDKGGPYAILRAASLRRDKPLASMLLWPDMSWKDLNELKASLPFNCDWHEPYNQHGDEGCIVGFSRRDTLPDIALPDIAEYLARICGPFSNKKATITNGGYGGTDVQPPTNPCMLNWYMPKRGGNGMSEVRVNWRSQAETILHVPRRGDRSARSRPKTFLVACGGELHNTGKTRGLQMRGSTLLPAEDGGRAAMLWLMAAGVPRDAGMVALVAPAFAAQVPTKEFEIRAFHLWQRIFWLGVDDPLTSEDLRAVNAYRSAALAFQRCRPHRLAGVWKESTEGREILLESLGLPPDAAAEAAGPAPEILTWSWPSAASGDSLGTLDGRQGEVTWQLRRHDKPGEVVGSAEEGDGGSTLTWTDGSKWSRMDGGSSEGYPLLGQIGQATAKAFLVAAEALFRRTTDETELMGRGSRPESTFLPAGGRRRWPPRLVPLTVQQPSEPGRGVAAPHLEPLDLARIEALIESFSAQLRPEDVEVVGRDGRSLAEGLGADEEDEDGELDEGEDVDDDPFFDISQERVDEEFMWKLAEEPNCSPATGRSLTFVETALALPRNPTCFVCQLELTDRHFSKRQLFMRPDRRKCTDCATAKQDAYKPVSAGLVAQAKPQSGGTVIRAEALQAHHLKTTTSQVKVCSQCAVQLTKDNCSTNQLAKTPSLRKCLQCVASAGAGTGKPTTTPASGAGK